MRVTCVIDNAVLRSSFFWGEHGLAFLIDTGRKRVLFDTGQSGAILLHNLEVLAIDPATIDAVILSHAHNDHAGGLKRLMERIRPGIPLYAHLDLFRERFSRKDGKIYDKSFSISPQMLEQRFELHLSPEHEEILPGVWTTGGITERTEPEGRSPDHLMRQGEDLVPDAYRDDMALVLQMDDHVLVLCGCCHAGLLNTLAHVERIFGLPIAFVAGGLHLTTCSADQVLHVGEILSSISTLQRIYPNHCTGEVAFVSLTNTLGGCVVRPCPVGTELDLVV